MKTNNEYIWKYNINNIINITEVIINIYLRIGSCLACVYWVTDAHGKFGEYKRSVRVAWGNNREQL